MFSVRRVFASISGVLLLGLFTVSSLADDVPRTPQDADELEAEEVREPAEQRVDFRVSLITEQDDNILHLRDDSVDEFESGAFAPDRFLINSVDDVIFIPSFDLAYSLTPESRRRSRVRLTTDVYQYMENSIKDYEQYRLTFEQDFSDARVDLHDLELAREDLSATRFRTRRAFRLANRSRLRLSYLHGPNRYQSQLTDDDGGGRQSAYFVTDAWDVRYYQRLNRGDANRFRLLLRAGRDEIDYNVEFDERDSERDHYAVGLDLFNLWPGSYWQWGLTYGFAERRSNTALIGQRGPAGTIEDDLSYDAEVVTLSAGRFWYHEQGLRALYKANSLRVSLRFGEKDYITTNPGDLTHFGRNDDYLAVSASYTHALSNYATARLRVQYAEQTTNLDPLGGLDRLEPSDFDNVVFGFQLSYYTGWKSRTKRQAPAGPPVVVSEAPPQLESEPESAAEALGYE